ncbi:hypothetical protein CROQUDRAFT_97026 [Cronartium quercuum f. sp. fusiforme G11]|uniref:GST N-terminal domain-containing protein n=1 Tax=Cronartium quercuum f. sp. fusiforme G11 TaxID=708437 RepID=A0A9P6NF53_9BASI|nr:hypothetical protein CROQUDRAFT_97026 [Cronartium quercuum f. sp. fusiforme G11]
MTLVLVGDQTSPFTQRTLFALHLKQIEFDYQESTIEQKSLDANTSNPTHYLPFLIYNHITVTGGSVNLIQFLEEAFPNHIPHLLSNDLIERSRQRLWSDYIRQFAVPLFIRTLRAPTDDTRSDALALSSLANTLDTYAQACQGPYFSGQNISLPDILIAPFLAHSTKAIARHINRNYSNTSEKFHNYSKSLLSISNPNIFFPTKLLLNNSIETDEGELAENVIESIPSPSSIKKRLPVEILSQIFTYLSDYELAETLGIPHTIPETPPWKDSTTSLDKSILTGSLQIVKTTYEVKHHRSFTQWGARVMIRFGFLNILDYLLKVEINQLHRICDYLLPELSSAWGRVDVLEWAIKSKFGIPKQLNENSIDEASRNGHVNILEWWKQSNLKLTYSINSLNLATQNSNLNVLNWWKCSGLELKIGNVLDFGLTLDSLNWWKKSGLNLNYSKLALYQASCQGNLNVLDWWLNESGLQLVFDKDVLIGSTKNGKVESLNWWSKSGLTIHFSFFDIEEAIEDCIDQKSKDVKDWWSARGLDLEGGASGWTTTRLLGNC